MVLSDRSHAGVRGDACIRCAVSCWPHCSQCSHCGHFLARPNCMIGRHCYRVCW